MNGYKGRAEFVEKLNKLVDDNHHYLYLIDGVFDGVRSIEKSIREYEIKEPTRVSVLEELFENKIGDINNL